MRFIYLNTQNLYPPDKHLIDGLRESGHEIYEINKYDNKLSYWGIFKLIRKDCGKFHAVIVGYPSPILAIFARITTFKKIIFNAVSSQYEANVVSRGVNPISIQAFKWWLLDFVSFHLSNKILLESNNQIDYVSRLFLLPQKKLVRSFMGINEKDFYFDPSIKKLDKFTVLFRGRFLPESGILEVIKSAKILENNNIDFRIVGDGFLYKEVGILMEKLRPQNIKIIRKVLPINELREKMAECHISLGQMANHPRLERTLPCKLFESLALKLPYITGRNKGVMEILEENLTCIAVNPGDPEDLSRKILGVINDHKKLEVLAESGYNLYRKKLTSKILSMKVIEECFK